MSFKTTKSIYEGAEVSDQVAYNLKTWIDYSLLKIMGYTNVGSGSNYYNLQRVKDPRYTDNKVFEMYGAGLVWENDVTPMSGFSAPIRASGVRVNGTFYPTNSGLNNYSNHYIDFLNGRVVFASGVPTNATVSADYSFRHVKVYLNDEPRWRRTVDDVRDKFHEIGSLSPSGIASILKENRVWMPSVVIDTGAVFTNPLQLGGGDIASVSVLYSTFSDTSFMNKKLCDILVSEEEKTLRLFNVNRIPRIYNNNGSLGSGALTYQQLIATNSPYFWTYAQLTETNGGPTENAVGFYRGLVRSIVNVDRYLSTY